MKKIDLYIIKKFLGTFFFACLLLAAVASVIDLTEKLDELIVHEVPLQVILFTYYLNFIPYILALLSPLMIFIALVFFTSKMASNSEIVAILASGVSFYRMLVPFFIAAGILAGILLVANHYVVPKANKNRLAFENNVLRVRYRYTQRNIHFQLSPTEFAYMESYNNRDSSGHKFALEKVENGRLVQKLRGDKVNWLKEEEKWRIKNYTVRQITDHGDSIFRGKMMDTVLGFYPSDFETRATFKEEMTTAELVAHIEREESKGKANLEAYHIEKHRRTSDAFLVFIMTLIGVAIASRKVRGGLGLHLVIGLGFAASYIVFTRFSTTFSTNSTLPPFWGVWIPNIIYGIVGALLVRWAPK